MFLSLEHLNKTYNGGKVAVDDFNLEIEKGEFVCFIGTSGSGKTTTMRMINRMLQQTSGTIKLDGQDISELDPVKLRRKIGYVIQNIGLMPHMTIRQNITIVPKLLKWSQDKMDERAKEMIKLVELPEEFLDRYPSELSGGQQQRIGVVRALAADQDLILMDEPFGALDPITREALQDLVKDLQTRLGKTIVFVTHDMDEALNLATTIVVMDAGKIMQVATPDEILRHPANEFVENLIGKERLIQAKPSITTVGQVMLTKVAAITPDRLLKDALKEMHERRVDSLLVVDQGGTLKGRLDIEDVDYNFRTATSVGDVMHHDVFYVYSDSVIRDTVERILKRGFKNIPVVDRDRKLVGIVTRATLVDMVYDALWGDEEVKDESSDAEKDGEAK
ncbi:betaine/proline/choline family ABC transporter ATP-binding protein [Secundilactobacillus kimchicus]|uniref:Quaternary amine transport ATP-binding protein n=1 Tax=Secundilactobacillus kimchicus JCM 15530 TaxID=1302272 RepID=A0A0R1HSX6_9LACO|nr:betaine/proline/choline family ABC transporter ATP-binding protein [Secundilactobacillus kimchicus]KRK47587.1 glycine betaine carnitine choline ABC transporter ATP-binding protein [Secundilactobacillus kimchicus JCM 15530]MBT9672229.1 betaine/proline/choline family ABC transporter ATP-binding protein [Secundilactobacillus kimchicus]